MVNTYPQIWMEVNKTDRGNGGLISTPLRLHFGSTTAPFFFFHFGTANQMVLFFSRPTIDWQ